MSRQGSTNSQPQGLITHGPNWEYIGATAKQKQHWWWHGYVSKSERLWAWQIYQMCVCAHFMKAIYWAVIEKKAYSRCTFRVLCSFQYVSSHISSKKNDQNSWMQVSTVYYNLVRSPAGLMTKSMGRSRNRPQWILVLILTGFNREERVACPFGTLVFTYKNIRCHNPEDLNLSSHRSVNLETYLGIKLCSAHSSRIPAAILQRFLITVSVRFTTVSSEFFFIIIIANLQST
jgi:hypothetical protein